jgi:vacuolar iron transporter family protein
MPVQPKEQHRIGRTGWLRAAVLGANDGILSTASLLLGVATAHATHSSVLVAGVAGLVAGGMSMAAGEYVSVHSQADTEKAELELERKELKTDNRGEHKELAAIYVARGLEPALAKQVAAQLMAHDALAGCGKNSVRGAIPVCFRVLNQRFCPPEAAWRDPQPPLTQPRA